MIKSKGFDGLYKLIDTQTGLDVTINDVYLMDEGIEYRVMDHSAAPHKPGSTGRIYVQPVDRCNGSERSFFPSVMGLEWVHHE